MKSSEIQRHEARVAQYRALEKVRDEISTALNAVIDPWEETGPSGQNPFTSNMRESRQLASMMIKFTATRGGACPVDIEITNMHIEAWQLGRALEI